MSGIGPRLQAVLARIAAAENRYGRKPGSVKLIAASKTQPAENLRPLIAAKQRRFGESFVQEALNKIHTLAAQDIEWHFIGAIQANKTKAIAENFCWVHSVDRLKIACRLNEHRPAHLPQLNVCVQVNISREPTKSGVRPEELIELAAAVTALPRLRLRGLMALPSPSDEYQEQREAFAEVREMMEQLNRHGHNLDVLSMGMSTDLEAAVAENTTFVRIGTALFGPRHCPV